MLFKEGVPALLFLFSRKLLSIAPLNNGSRTLYLGGFKGCAQGLLPYVPDGSMEPIKRFIFNRGCSGLFNGGCDGVS